MSLYQVSQGGTVNAADVNQYYNLLTGATTDQPVTIANRIRATNTGASTATGYMGGVAGAAPASGTFVTGDIVFDTTYGGWWYCTAGGTPGTWAPPVGAVQISKQTLGGDAAAVTFSSIPTVFAHLRLDIMARGTAAAASTPLVAQINSDTGAHYEWATTTVSNVPATSLAANASDTALRVWQAMPAASAATNVFGRCIIDVPMYADTGTLAKQILAAGAGPTTVVQQAAGSWIPTSSAAVTRLDLSCAVGNVKAGSVFTLYGVA